jgi:CDP-diacylglycerol--serine O-phosphatidyltransferase
MKVDLNEIRLRRGIFLLPNLLTTVCLFGGFYAIIAAIDGNFERAAIAIFGAMIFDGLDGRVARLMGTETAFGKEFDSLADMVAFGVAPAFVCYQWGVARISEYGSAWGRFGWIAAFFFAAATAMRLARFNARSALQDKRYFEGLPSPSAAAVVAAFVGTAHKYETDGLLGFDVTGLPGLILAFVVTALAAILMVSRFPYRSFKDRAAPATAPETMEARRLAILEAMGVQAYVPRAAAPDGPDWDTLAATVRSCRLCGLCETRTQTVFGTGDARARLMVIGEAPGAEEDRQGEPFVGRAGMLLNSMLRAAGFERGEVYIANVLKCRPPNNRDPSAEEAERCLPYLRRQIELVAPEVILCVGRIAAQRLLGREEALARMRGRVHRFESVPVVVTYHPAYLLRAPGEKRKSWADLQLAIGILGRGDGA